MYRIILALSLLSACVVAETENTLTIANQSSYVLTEVYVAEVDDASWGPNLLSDDLYPGEDLIVTNFDCDYYDVLVVDETGVECELRDLELCFDDATWVIDDFTLDVCAFA